LVKAALPWKKRLEQVQRTENPLALGLALALALEQAELVLEEMKQLEMLVGKD
jgi:hypothetical protein